MENIKFQHIGIPVENVGKTAEWYVKELGFSVVGDFQVGEIRAIFVSSGNVTIELYQLPDGVELEAVRNNPGRIDHLAFQVDDIDKAYEEAIAQGMKIEMERTTMPFWEKGSTFFMVRTTTGEKLEFNQKL